MMDKRLPVNYEGQSEDKYIDNDDVYVNRTGAWEPYESSFIHNTCELLFVEEGEAEYLMNDACYTVSKNSVFIIGATDFHVCRVRRAPYIRYGLYFMPRYLATLPMIREYLDVYTTHSPEQMARLNGLPQPVFDELCSLLHKLHRETPGGGDSRVMREALTCEMTVCLKRLLGIHREQGLGGDRYGTMLQVRSFIDDHFAEDCSLNRLSAEFYIQPATISRYFRESFDVTIGNYIARVRVSYAVKLLKTTGESVTEIANRVGYNNVNTFIRAFTRIMQISPLQYRKRDIENSKRRDYPIGMDDGIQNQP